MFNRCRCCECYKVQNSSFELKAEQVLSKIVGRTEKQRKSKSVKISQSEVWKEFSKIRPIYSLC